jgi:hypothetical protein
MTTQTFFAILSLIAFATGHWIWGIILALIAFGN